MKRKFFVLVLVAVTGFVSYRVGKNGRDLEGYGHAAEWGCVQEAKRACQYLEQEEAVETCYLDASHFCPQIGEAYKEFMPGK